METLHPNFENLLSELQYVLDVIRETFYLPLFTHLENSPRNILSGLRYIRYPLCPPGYIKSGIRYVVYLLYPVWQKTKGSLL